MFPLILKLSLSPKEKGNSFWDIWACLTEFSQPQLFLTVIKECEVLEDTGESILREVTFQDGKYAPLAPYYIALNSQVVVSVHLSFSEKRFKRESHISSPSL